MRVHCCQFSPSWEDQASNFEAVATLLRQEKIEAGSLVILPEMFSTGFSMEFAKIAEDLGNSATLDFLAEQARSYQCAFVAGMAVKVGEALTNDAILIDRSGTLVGRYSKIHPFSPSGEGAAAMAGSWVVTMPLADWTLAPFVCYDLRFPEIFRAATPEAELLIVIANWPTPRVEHWVTLLRARAIENQAYVVGINRIGADPNLEFPGRSLIIDPKGEILADAGDREGVLSADLDLAALRQWRADFPAQADRHPPENIGVQNLASP